MFLNHISLQLYGESHKEKIGFILSNVPKNIKLDINKINYILNLRHKNNNYNTKRNNSEEIKIISGVENDCTTSRPIVIELLNNNINSKDYNKGVIRPSHADYVGYELDKDNYSYEGGGIFSGRNTALYVVVGEICKQIINDKYSDYEVISHLSEVNNIKDDKLNSVFCKDYLNLKEKDIQMISKDSEDEVLKLLNSSDDNYSGTVCTVVYNCPKLLGGYFLNNIKGAISGVMLSINSSRKISFGSDINNLDKYEVIDDKVSVSTTGGGISGGFTLGTNIEFSVSYKAPSTRFYDVNSIKYDNNNYSNEVIKMSGRHDSLICNRAYYAQDGLISLVLLDYMLFNGVYYD